MICLQIWFNRVQGGAATQGEGQLLEWARLRRRFAVCAAAAATLGAVVLVASALASSDCCRPTVVGDPVIGNELSVTFTTEDTATSSDTTGFDGLYRWQSCDPAVADCSVSSAHDDDNWTNLPASDPDPHKNPTYTIVPSDLGHFIRVLTHENSEGSKWRASDPVGPVTAPPKAAEPPPPLEPEHGISFLVQPAGGTVTVKAPGQSEFFPPPGRIFDVASPFAMTTSTSTPFSGILSPAFTTRC